MWFSVHIPNFIKIGLYLFILLHVVDYPAYTGKIGAKMLILGAKSPILGDFLAFFASIPVPTRQILSFDVNIVWIGQCWFLPVFFIFLLYPRPPNSEVLGGLCPPYWSWWSFTQVILYLTSNRIIWVLDDENRIISLVGTSVLVHSSSWITFCQKGAQKSMFLGSHAHIWGHMSTWPPKGTSLRQNTLFELLTTKIGQAVWSVCCFKKKKRKKTKEKNQFCGEFGTPYFRPPAIDPDNFWHVRSY